jgi:hypothetical protein
MPSGVSEKRENPNRAEKRQKCEADEKLRKSKRKKTMVEIAKEQGPLFLSELGGFFR